MGIRVKRAGILTTIQDGGRIGYQRYGVPLSGAMDIYSMNLANLLVGNPRNAAVFEITFTGTALIFEESVAIAVCGGDLTPRLNGEPVDMNRAMTVSTGDELTFDRVCFGCRAYLAVSAEIDVPSEMNSKSTYVQGNIGGFKGRRLQDGDVVPLLGIKIPKRVDSRVLSDKLILCRGGKENELRALLSSQKAAFTEEGIRKFFSSEYTVSLQNDRMGYRLFGNEIEHKEGEKADILSEGVGLGSVQVAGDGYPIIMCADHQTTGGYTKIAAVAYVDMPLVAQLKSGDKVMFVETDISAAQQMIRKRREVLDEVERILGNMEKRVFSVKKDISLLRQLRE